MDEKNTDSKESDGTKPLKVFREGDVSASVFGREHNSVTYYSVTFSRSYEQDGKRRYTKWFDREDLPKVIAVAKQADEYIGSLLSGA